MLARRAIVLFLCCSRASGNDGCAAQLAGAVHRPPEVDDGARLAHNEVLASLKAQEAALESQLESVRAHKEELLGSRRLRIGIVGFGPFGQFLAKTFVTNNDVVVASRSDYSVRAAELGAQSYVPLSDPAALFSGPPLDVLLISVSIVTFERVLASLAPHLAGRDVLVVDVLSVKEFPKRLFEAHVPASCDVLAAHPMFGPESGGGPSGWRGLNFVYDVVRVADRPEARDRLERFLSVWEEQGCRMVPMSAEQHDAHAASSQFVTHLTGRMLGNLKLR
jgi:arogenate dehydrogenase (NADP+)